MLIESVRVTPGMLPPTMSTTPNSPMVCAKLSAIPVTKPEVESGTSTRQKVRNFEAPNTSDADNRRESTDPSDEANGCTANGMLYSTEPITKPSNVNARLCPVIPCHQRPSGLRSP